MRSGSCPSRLNEPSPSAGKPVPASSAADRPSHGLAGRLRPHAQYWYLQVGLTALGGGLVLGGFHLDRPLIMDAGVLVLAAAAVASGSASILTRRLVFLWPGRRYRLGVWYGAAAILVGLGFVVLGLAVAAGALAHLGGMSLGQIRDAILERPWRVLTPTGFFMFANGLAMIVGFDRTRRGTSEAADTLVVVEPDRGATWDLLMSIPGRLGGLIGAAIGAAVLGIGCYEFLRPQAFDDLIVRLSHGWPW